MQNENRRSVANRRASFEDGENENPECQNWTDKFDFLLPVLKYCVGVNSVWRFSFLCFTYGGLFFIPYTIMVIISGVPIMFMEISFGQFRSLGQIVGYKRFSPLFKGLAYCMASINCIVMLYNNIITARMLDYIFASFNGHSHVPWSHCQHLWSNSDCITQTRAEWCANQNRSYYYELQCLKFTEIEMINRDIETITAIRKSTAEEYSENGVSGISGGIAEFGSFRLELAACLFLAWFIMFLCISKGVQRLRKVVYFTAFFLYVVLIALFVRGILLPQAVKAALLYLTSNWHRLASAKIWVDAAVQVFFALGPSWGGLITLSSRNKFNNNYFKDCIIVAVCNIATSFFGGLVTFSVITFLTHEHAVPAAFFLSGEADSAFIVYHEAMARLPFAPVWSLLLLLVLIVSGLDLQFTFIETVTTAILDEISMLRNFETWVVFGVSAFGYAGGIIFTTNAGIYWLQLITKYVINSSVLLIAIIECILVTWVYGTERFLNDVELMIGPRGRCFKLFWTVMWSAVTPTVIFLIFSFNCVKYMPYGTDIDRKWTSAIGWCVRLFPIFVIIPFVLYWLKSPKEQLSRNDDDEEQGTKPGPSDISERENRESLWTRTGRLQPSDEWRAASRNCVAAPTTLVRTGPPEDNSSDAMKDPLTVIDFEPMMVQTANASTMMQEFPGPSILKSASEADLITPQQS